MKGENNPFIDLLDVLRSYEENAATLIDKQRGHYIQSVNVFILGLCVYTQNGNFRAAFDAVNMDKKEEYEIETSILSDTDITEDFDENHKQWYFALSEILPLIDPTAEFDPDQYIIPELSSNPSVPSIWPAQGRITSEFGENRITHTHNGIDIANITGTPIYATADGTVIAVGSSGNFGKRIMIYHGTDESGTTYITIYAHLSQFKVNVGDKITQGTIIALMGNTDYSTGPHLHYEIRVNGSPINPRFLLP